jgi:hypothetical protein
MYAMMKLEAYRKRTSVQHSHYLYGQSEVAGLPVLIVDNKFSHLAFLHCLLGLHVTADTQMRLLHKIPFQGNVYRSPRPAVHKLVSRLLTVH